LSGVVKFEIGQDGRPALVKESKIEFVDDGPGRAVGINRFIGRRLTLAFGNSDSDLQMLQWTIAGAGPRFLRPSIITIPSANGRMIARATSAGSTRRSMPAEPAG
jgi:hypothetical protein